MKVLILDQFTWPSPYDLSRTPVQFDELCAAKLAEARADNWHKPRVEEIDEKTYRPDLCTTIMHADETGRAKVLMARWDSSG